MTRPKSSRRSGAFYVVGGPALVAIALVSILAAGAAVLKTPRERPAEEELGERWESAAQSIATSPAEPEAYLTLAELALDRGGEQRVELWRASVAASRRLAPSTDLPDRALVRGGFFHWPELEGAEREMVLEAAGRLLSDPVHYRTLWQPVLQATRDPSFLADHAPDDQLTRRQIRDLAASWGDGGTYLVLQREVTASLGDAVGSMEERELVDLLARLELSSAYLHDARTLFMAIDRRPESLPADLEKRVDDLAVRWQMFLPELRDRLGMEQDDVELPALRELALPAETALSSVATWQLPEDTPARIVIEAEPSEEMPSPALLEVRVDGVLRESRLVAAPRRFNVLIDRGAEIFELRLANPRTRNNEPRPLQVRMGVGAER